MKKQNHTLFLISNLICLVFFTSCTTTLNLTLNGNPPKNNRIFGHNVTRTLGGGMPAGGTYSGPGVKNGVFNPSLAGNGFHTITYSKFGCFSSTDKIEVHGAPTLISDKRCQGCGGTKKEECPFCKGKKKINNRQCMECEGKGERPCRKCQVDDGLSDDYTVIIDLLSQLSSSRISHVVHYGRTDDFILKLNLRFGYFNEFNPTIYLYIIETATGRLKKYTLPNRSSEKINDEEGSRYCKDTGGEKSFVSFLFKLEEDELIESNIRIIEVSASYGIYPISLFFDLKDIENKDKYLVDDLRLSFMLFNGKYYVFPKTFFIDEINDDWEKITRDKGWQTEEIDFGWLLQKNNKGEKRILDRERKIRVESGKKYKAEEIDVFWEDVKYQLEDNYGFWKKWLKNNSPETMEAWNKHLSSH